MIVQARAHRPPSRVIFGALATPIRSDRRNPALADADARSPASRIARIADQQVETPGHRIASAKRAAVCASAMSSRSEEHTSELQSLMRISYAVFCLKKK